MTRRRTAAPAALVPTFAHQGGWDELLIFGIPVVLAIVAVRWAERRGRERREQDGEPRPSSSEPAGRDG